MEKVYYLDSRVKDSVGLLEKTVNLLDNMKTGWIRKNSIICIKTHFGEDGNTSFVSPLYIRKIVDYVKKNGAHPFIGDTNTLYSGRRKMGVTHLELAAEHGFCSSVVNAPLVILDGLKSNSRIEIEVRKKHFDSISLAGEIQDIDGMIMVSHFKGHLGVGLGGAIKNLSMGLGTRKQKQLMHSDVKPVFKADKCIFCRKCVNICPVQCISLTKDNMQIDYDSCLGCAECIVTCPTGALKILWNETPENMAEKLSETAFGAVELMKRKVMYLNFLINITPNCDCLGASDNSIVEDIGVLLSFDPVAIDMASLDLVNSAQRTHNSILPKKEGEVFKTLHDHTNPEHQILYGEEIGLGSKDYKLVKIN